MSVCRGWQPCICFIDVFDNCHSLSIIYMGFSLYFQARKRRKLFLTLNRSKSQKSSHATPSSTPEQQPVQIDEFGAPQKTNKPAIQHDSSKACRRSLIYATSEESVTDSMDLAESVSSNRSSLVMKHDSNNETPWNNEYVAAEQSSLLGDSELSDIKAGLAKLNVTDKEACTDLITFFHLLSMDRFPTNNIAFQLFLDTVRWYSSSKSTLMRYRDTCKQFWLTGFTLFHGQFLRFMQGDRQDGVESTQSTRINFCCAINQNTAQSCWKVSSGSP